MRDSSSTKAPKKLRQIGISLGHKPQRLPKYAIPVMKATKLIQSRQTQLVELKHYPPQSLLELCNASAVISLSIHKYVEAWSDLAAAETCIHV